MTTRSIQQRLGDRLRGLASGAMARGALGAFVVPGPDVARARGLDLEAAGLEASPTPRHAGALVLIGELPENLRRSAAVAYSQMPRPRVMLAVGAENHPPLPEPDLSIPLEQEALERAAAEARTLLAEKVFDPDKNETIPEDDDANRPRNEENAGEEKTEDPAGELESSEEPGESHAGMNRDHAGRGGMGFMSMVAMTEGTPRSSDGLQMEWVAAAFGPLFPGLPGGLALDFTLDGDVVAESEASSVVGMRRLEGMSGPAESFADWLSGLDPFSPVAYRVLALRAFEDAAGISPDERTTLARIGALERERAASHLGWLASFGCLAGHARLAERAGKLQLALLRAGGGVGSARLRASGASEVSRLKVQTDRLVGSLRRDPLLARRLKGVGAIPENAETSGPVTRARGARADTRAGEEGYRSLGLEGTIHEEDDALSRMLVRLAEISHSLDLVLAAGSASIPSDGFDYSLSGRGEATVETPRGKATLRLSLRGRGVSGLELDTPSTRHIGLVGSVAEGRELADALVGVASLDLSPWEVLH